MPPFEQISLSSTSKKLLDFSSLLLPALLREIILSQFSKFSSAVTSEKHGLAYSAWADREAGGRIYRVVGWAGGKSVVHKKFVNSVLR